MTGKQIMIDGVDVSKCIFFNKNYKEDDVQIKNFCELQYISCKEFDCANCYFKKWKRKEQECEELKEAKDGLLKIQYQLADSCNKYVQTLTKIKEIVVTENNDIKVLYNRRTYQRMKQILQKISECGESIE